MPSQKALAELFVKHRDQGPGGSINFGKLPPWRRANRLKNWQISLRFLCVE